MQQVQAMQPQMNQGMLPIPPFHPQMYQQNHHLNCKKIIIFNGIFFPSFISQSKILRKLSAETVQCCSDFQELTLIKSYPKTDDFATSYKN